LISNQDGNVDIELGGGKAFTLTCPDPGAPCPACPACPEPPTNLCQGDFVEWIDGEGCLPKRGTYRNWDGDLETEPEDDGGAMFASRSEVDDILDALPLGAYRRLPGQNCSAIKAAMFDNGNRKYWTGDTADQAKLVFCDMTGDGAPTGDGSSIATSSASCSTLYEQYGEFSAGAYWIDSVRVVCSYDENGSPMQAGGDGSTVAASSPSCQMLLDVFGADHLAPNRFVDGKSIKCTVSADGATAAPEGRGGLSGFGALQLTSFGTFAKDNSNSVNEAGESLGDSCSSFASPPVSTSGREIGRMEYTPTQADSELLISGRPITIQETANVMNDWRISAHLEPRGSRAGKLLGWSGCAWSHDLQNPNVGLLTLRVATPSWGKDDKGTIVFRMHAEDSCDKAFFQFNVRYAKNFLPAPVLFTIEEGSSKQDKGGGGSLVQMKVFAEKGWGTVVGSAQSLGETMDGTKQPTYSEGLTVIEMDVTVAQGSSQLLIEGPPIPISEIADQGDDYRIAVFDSQTSALLGWSGGSYSWKTMSSGKNIGVMTLKVLTAPGKVKPGKCTLVVKVAASGVKGAHYHYNTRYLYDLCIIRLMYRQDFLFVCTWSLRPHAEAWVVLRSCW
jgi:hypothetical protein